MRQLVGTAKEAMGETEQWNKHLPKGEQFYRMCYIEGVPYNVHHATE